MKRHLKAFLLSILLLCVATGSVIVVSRFETWIAVTFLSLCLYAGSYYIIGKLND